MILCERGIRTFETATRNTTDINAIPVLKARTHLPVILDPSHATGYAAYVPAVARAAVAAGADDFDRRSASRSGARGFPTDASRSPLMISPACCAR